MSEVVKLAIEAAPAAAATVSFVAGRVFLGVAQRREGPRQAPGQVLDDVSREYLDQEPTDADSLTHELPEEPSIREIMIKGSAESSGHKDPSTAADQAEDKAPRKIRRESALSRIVLRSLPFFCAAAGYVIADAVKNEAQPVGRGPTIPFVVDRAGSTEGGSDSSDDTSPKLRTDELLRRFGSRRDEITESVYSAGGETVDEYTLEDAVSEKVIISGDAPMKDAFRNAAQRAVYADSRSETGKKGAAIVVATNGNDFGSLREVKRLKVANIPVFVIDTSDKASTGSASSRDIAEKTGGSFYDKNDDPNKVVNEVIDSLDPAAVEEGIDINLLPAAGLFLAGLGLSFREARRMPLTFSGLKQILKQKGVN